jgi:hypothetical protein
MRILPFALVGAALLVSACGTTSDPWVADQHHAAGATAGVRSLLKAHFAVDEACAPLPLPTIAVSVQPKLGTLTVEETVASVVDPGGECDGRSVPAAGIFYETTPGTVGFDELAYVEVVEGGEPDRVHTLFVRVR